MSLQKLDLRKKIVVDLKKTIGLDGQIASVVCVLDVSPSMRELYISGKMQELTERLLGLAMGFDDNGSIDMYGFSTDVFKAPDCTIDNYQGYIDRWITHKIDGGTNYAPVVKKIVSQFGQRGGILSLGKPKKIDVPVFVIWITDGDNFDKPETTTEIIDASAHGIFFQFVGIGGARFSYLEKLDTLPGRKVDNCGFFKVNDPGDFDDTMLYKLLLTELPSFIKQAREKDLIK